MLLVRHRIWGKNQNEENSENDYWKCLFQNKSVSYLRDMTILYPIVCVRFFYTGHVLQTPCWHCSLLVDVLRTVLVHHMPEQFPHSCYYGNERLERVEFSTLERLNKCDRGQHSKLTYYWNIQVQCTLHLHSVRVSAVTVYNTRSKHFYECTYSVNGKSANRCKDHIQYTLWVRSAPISAVRFYTEHAHCSGVWTASLHFTFIANRWVNWQCTFNVHCESVSASTAYNASALCTGDSMYSVHWQCIVHRWGQCQRRFHVQCATVSASVWTESVKCMYSVHLYVHWQCILHMKFNPWIPVVQVHCVLHRFYTLGWCKVRLWPTWWISGVHHPCTMCASSELLSRNIAATPTAMPSWQIAVSKVCDLQQFYGTSICNSDHLLRV